MFKSLLKLCLTLFSFFMLSIAGANPREDYVQKWLEKNDLNHHLAEVKPEQMKQIQFLETERSLQSRFQSRDLFLAKLLTRHNDYSINGIYYFLKIETYIKDARRKGGFKRLLGFTFAKDYIIARYETRENSIDAVVISNSSLLNDKLEAYSTTYFYNRKEFDRWVLEDLSAKMKKSIRGDNYFWYASEVESPENLPKLKELVTLIQKQAASGIYAKVDPSNLKYENGMWHFLTIDVEKASTIKEHLEVLDRMEKDVVQTFGKYRWDRKSPVESFKRIKKQVQANVLRKAHFSEEEIKAAAVEKWLQENKFAEHFKFLDASQLKPIQKHENRYGLFDFLTRRSKLEHVTRLFSQFGNSIAITTIIDELSLFFKAAYGMMEEDSPGHFMYLLERLASGHNGALEQMRGFRYRGRDFKDFISLKSIIFGSKHIVITYKEKTTQRRVKDNRSFVNWLSGEPPFIDVTYENYEDKAVVLSVVSLMEGIKETFNQTRPTEKNIFVNYTQEEFVKNIRKQLSQMMNSKYGISGRDYFRTVQVLAPYLQAGEVIQGLPEFFKLIEHSAIHKIYSRVFADNLWFIKGQWHFLLTGEEAQEHFLSMEELENSMGVAGMVNRDSEFFKTLEMDVEKNLPILKQFEYTQRRFSEIKTKSVESRIR